MNCSLCKYRSNLYGFEREVGLLQESHHDHVDGLGMSCDLCESECNGACENESQVINENQDQSNSDSLQTISDHDHSHGHLHTHKNSLYPNSKHPLGPVTLRSLNE